MNRHLALKALAPCLALAACLLLGACRGPHASGDLSADMADALDESARSPYGWGSRYQPRPHVHSTTVVNKKHVNIYTPPKPHVNIYNPPHNHTTAAKKITPAPVKKNPIITKTPAKKKVGC
jgi:hypothetical protein